MDTLSSMAHEERDFTITNFRPGEDETFVSRMHAASLAVSVPDWTQPDDHEEKIRQDLARFAAGETDHVILVARDEEGPLGIHWLQPRLYPDDWGEYDETWPFPELNGRRVAYISNTAVSAHARRRGVARALKAEGYVRARQLGCACVLGGVSIHNPAMQALNQREGFITQPPRDRKSVWIAMYRMV